MAVSRRKSDFVTKKKTRRKTTAANAKKAPQNTKSRIKSFSFFCVPFSSLDNTKLFSFSFCKPNKVPRLAALLTLKAVIQRRWKDRGRQSQKATLDEDTKTRIRDAMLSFVTTGTSNSNDFDRELSLILINDKTLQVLDQMINIFTYFHLVAN